MSEKILIIGLGMIGYELVKKFQNLDYDVYIITRRDKGYFKDTPKYLLDITNRERLFETVNKISPDFVVNTAAITNVDLCEEERELAYKTNALAVGYIGEVCKDLKIPLCHISTDYVFDGRKGNYIEEDEVNPVNYYGWTKAQGEIILNNLNYEDITILRISVPYCFSPVKDNFFTWVLKGLKEGKEIKAVVDQWNTPTYVYELTEGIVKIYEKGIRGLYHFGGGEKVSRYEFTLKVAEVFGYDKELIKPVKSSELRWKAKRPRDTSLNSSKIQKSLNIRLKNLEESLKDLREMMTDAL
ncbi:dTDP-4-dehydrorhamnose reductase [Methanothermococcus sp. SCGC AD-155-N22]|nr:dTDP-4-dehydrorhamnose reductase [Methanothermococcus sp. SCGC AD-155-N22]